MREVVVVGTSVANIASVLAALRRAGAEPVVSIDPVAVAAARRVVLPGVGAFEAAMAALRAAGIEDVLAERVRARRSLLAICLGLQLLAEGSDESPGVAGLGVVPGIASRFPASVRVPQLGWNRVRPARGARAIEAGSAYFANSYRIEAIPAGWSGATAEYAGPFVAALERGPVIACQFHPELSGAWGAALIRRWWQMEDAC
ncbi:MAG TPA: imidazole glycerol phosphate synthase subunit HisH [Vicinamibacterales bacterium]|nr:imidazole glycerol phosphate synthase subunit HisH [Vicinamibacterales bacterium]